jgi:TBC1 domain family protein 5
MRAQQKALARAIAWSVDALMQDSENLDPRKRDALECLSYVRDVLTVGNIIRLDEDRLGSHHTAPSSAPINASATAQTRDTQENSGETTAVPPVPLVEPDSPRVMLSKRDSRPLTGLTRTPQVPQTMAPNVYGASARSPPAQQGTTSSAPATMNRFAPSQVSRPPARPPPPWQSGPLTSPTATQPLPDHHRSDSVQSSTFQPNETPQVSTSTYPPKRLDSHPTGTRMAAVSVDPLGVLK